ncbi:MAG: hypothetical protein LBR24_03840 [Methanobrevibacter sp.]|jgi:hypothetical protein|nr:hypothetical protein [Methanobrevibacter sp.]
MKQVREFLTKMQQLKNENIRQDLTAWNQNQIYQDVNDWYYWLRNIYEFKENLGFAFDDDVDNIILTNGPDFFKDTNGIMKINKANYQPADYTQTIFYLPWWKRNINMPNWNNIFPTMAQHISMKGLDPDFKRMVLGQATASNSLAIKALVHKIEILCNKEPHNEKLIMLDLNNVKFDKEGLTETQKKDLNTLMKKYGNNTMLDYWNTYQENFIKMHELDHLDDTLPKEEKELYEKLHLNEDFNIKLPERTSPTTTNENNTDDDTQDINYLFNLINGELSNDDMLKISQISHRDWRYILYEYFVLKSEQAKDTLEKAGFLGTYEKKCKIPIVASDGRKAWEYEKIRVPIPNAGGGPVQYQDVIKTETKPKSVFKTLLKRMKQAEQYVILTTKEKEDPNEIYKNILAKELFIPQQNWDEKYVKPAQNAIKDQEYHTKQDAVIAVNKFKDDYMELKRLNQIPDAVYLEGKKAWSATREASQKRLQNLLIECFNKDYREDDIGNYEENKYKKDYWQADLKRNYVLQLINSTWHEWGFPDYPVITDILNKNDIKECFYDRETKKSILGVEYYRRNTEEERLKAYNLAIARAKTFFHLFKHHLSIKGEPIKHSVLLGDYHFLNSRNPFIKTNIEDEQNRKRILNTNWGIGTRTLDPNYQQYADFKKMVNEILEEEPEKIPENKMTKLTMDKINPMPITKTQFYNDEDFQLTGNYTHDNGNDLFFQNKSKTKKFRCFYYDNELHGAIPAWLKKKGIVINNQPKKPGNYDDYKPIGFPPDERFHEANSLLDYFNNNHKNLDVESFWQDLENYDIQEVYKRPGYLYDLAWWLNEKTIGINSLRDWLAERYKDVNNKKLIQNYNDVFSQKVPGYSDEFIDNRWIIENAIKLKVPTLDNYNFDISEITQAEPPKPILPRIKENDFVVLPYKKQVALFKQQPKYYGQFMDPAWEFSAEDELLAFDIHTKIINEMVDENSPFRLKHPHPYHLDFSKLRKPDDMSGLNWLFNLKNRNDLNVLKLVNWLKNDKSYLEHELYQSASPKIKRLIHHRYLSNNLNNIPENIPKYLNKTYYFDFDEKHPYRPQFQPNAQYEIEHYNNFKQNEWKNKFPLNQLEFHPNRSSPKKINKFNTWLNNNKWTLGLLSDRYNQDPFEYTPDIWIYLYNTSLHGIPKSTDILKFIGKPLKYKQKNIPYSQYRRFDDKTNQPRILFKPEVRSNINESDLLEIGTVKDNIPFALKTQTNIKETINENNKHPVNCCYAIAQKKWISNLMKTYGVDAQTLFTNMPNLYLLPFEDLQNVEYDLHESFNKNDMDFWARYGHNLHERTLKRNYALAKSIMRDVLKVPNISRQLKEFIEQECKVNSPVPELIVHNYNYIMKNKNEPVKLKNILINGAIDTTNLRNHQAYPAPLSTIELNRKKPTDPPITITFQQNGRNVEDHLRIIENDDKNVVFESEIFYNGFPYVIPKNKAIDVKRDIIIDNKIIPRDPTFYKQNRQTDSINDTFMINELTIKKLSEEDRKKVQETPNPIPYYPPIYRPHNIPQEDAWKPLAVPFHNDATVEIPPFDPRDYNRLDNPPQPTPIYDPKFSPYYDPRQKPVQVQVRFEPEKQEKNQYVQVEYNPNGGVSYIPKLMTTDDY